MMNKKGFVLIETIVTAVFVLGLFTFLIANILPLVGDYERTLDYDSIESKYNAHLIRKMILKDNSCRIKNLITLPSKGYYEFEGTNICLYLGNSNYCNKLLSSDYLDVDRIILTSYNTETLKNNKDSFNRAVSTYINNMPKFNNTTYCNDRTGCDDAEVNLAEHFYKRRLIVVFNSGAITNIELLVNYDSLLDCGGATC